MKLSLVLLIGLLASSYAAVIPDTENDVLENKETEVEAKVATLENDPIEVNEVEAPENDQPEEEAETADAATKSEGETAVEGETEDLVAETDTEAEPAEEDAETVEVKSEERAETESVDAEPAEEEAETVEVKSEERAETESVDAEPAEEEAEVETAEAEPESEEIEPKAGETATGDAEAEIDILADAGAEGNNSVIAKSEVAEEDPTDVVENSAEIEEKESNSTTENVDDDEEEMIDTTGEGADANDANNTNSSEEVVMNSTEAKTSVEESGNKMAESKLTLQERVKKLIAQNEELKKSLEKSRKTFNPVASQRGFWPLRGEYRGQNLVLNASNVQLHGVNFNPEANQWLNAPARFTGQDDSFAEIPSCDDVIISKSFSWIAAVNRKTTGDGTLFEWDQDGSIATHIWIRENRLYMDVVFQSCPSQNIFFTSTVDNNKWYVFAASFEVESGTISLWVDGVRETKTATCTGDLKAGSNALINKSIGDTLRLNAEISCMGLFDEAISYNTMYQNTIQQCKQ